MEVVLVADCNNCGKFPVLGTELVTIFKLRDEYQTVMVCAYCERLMVDHIDPKSAKRLKFKDVRVLDWMLNEK